MSVLSRRGRLTRASRVLVVLSLPLLLTLQAQADAPTLVSESAAGLVLEWTPGPDGLEVERLAVPIGHRPVLAGAQNLSTGHVLSATELSETGLARLLQPGYLGLVATSELHLQAYRPGSSETYRLHVEFVPLTPAERLARQAAAPAPGLSRPLHANGQDAARSPAPSRPVLNPGTLRRASASAERPVLPGPAERLPSGSLTRRLPLSQSSTSGPVRRPGLPGGPPQAMGLEDGRVKIEVDRAEAIDRDGIYRIRYEELAAAGVDLTDTDPAELRLSTWYWAVSGRGSGESFRFQELEVPIRVVDQGAAGVFDAGDFFEFWGEAWVSEGGLFIAEHEVVPWQGYFQGADYTDTNVYWLDAVGTPGPRLGDPELSRDATPNPGTPQLEDFKQTARAEVNNWFLPNHRTRRQDVDHFYWCPSLIGGSAITERNEVVELIDLNPSSSRLGELRVRVLNKPSEAGSGIGEIDHWSRLHVNGTQVSELMDDAGLSDLTHTATGLGAGLLATNAPVLVRLEQPDLSEPNLLVQRVELNSIEIDYPRSFVLHEGQLSFKHEGAGRVVVSGLGASTDVTILDVTDVLAPVLLTGAVSAPGTVEFELLDDPVKPVRRYAVRADDGGPPSVAPTSLSWVPQSTLRDAGNQADVLLIGPAAWLEPPLPGVMEYINHRASRGLVVKLATMESLVDEFSGGRLSPFALSHFYLSALTEWSRAPQYAVLLGDANVDYKDELNGELLLASSCAVGPSGACTPEEVYETEWAQYVPTFIFDNPTDTVFLGHYASDSFMSLVLGADTMPDINVGRLPARTPEHAEAMLRKVIRYEGLVDSPPAWADRALMVADEIDPTKPVEDKFESCHEDAFADYLDPYYRTTTYYHSDYADPDQLSSELLADWDAGESAAVLSFVGHGNPSRWSNDVLVSNREFSPCRNDTADLTSAAPPIILNVGCISGAFEVLSYPSLLEQLVRIPFGGAIAAYGPTGTTDVSTTCSFTDSFYDSIFGPSGRGSGRLGDVIRTVQLRVDGSLLHDDLYGNVLLGDPALELVVPHGPSGLGLRAVAGNMRVDVDWDAVPEAVSYALYRSEDGPAGDFVRVRDAAPGLTYADVDVVNGTLYHYAAEPVSAEGYPGPWSEIAAARPCSTDPPEEPGDFNITGGPGQVVIFFPGAPGTDIAFYRITKRLGHDPDGPIIDVQEQPGTLYSEAGLAPCTPLTYEIHSVNSCGIESPVGKFGTTTVSPCPLVMDPPLIIRDLMLHLEGPELVLDWSEVTQTVLGNPVTPPIEYVVYQAILPDFLAEPGQEIGREAGLNHRLTASSGPMVEFYAVAAEDPGGNRGPVGHDLPQGVGELTQTPQGGMVDLSWDPVLLDISGIRTPIATYHVYGAAAPLSRQDVDGMMPLVSGPETMVTVPTFAEYFVLAEDVHGNRGAW